MDEANGLNEAGEALHDLYREAFLLVFEEKIPFDVFMPLTFALISSVSQGFGITEEAMETVYQKNLDIYSRNIGPMNKLAKENGWYGFS